MWMAALLQWLGLKAWMWRSQSISRHCFASIPSLMPRSLAFTLEVVDNRNVPRAALTNVARSFFFVRGCNDAVNLILHISFL
jgi:hypothetical protein